MTAERKTRLASFLASMMALAVGLAVFMAVSFKVEILQRLDLALFGWLSGHPGEVAGTGSADDPRMIERFEVAAEVAPLQALFLDDEEDGFFEQVPPPPADVMVLMARLQERGVKAMGVGYPLQWDDPDTLAVEAMRRVMDRMDGLVLGYRLKDSTAPAPVAAPFQRASLAYSEVIGDGTKLPVVNGIRGVAPEMGGDRSLAGFTGIETEEPDAEREYLLARWSDRVVFALPLAVEVARRGLSFDEVHVHMGRFIRLGTDGPRIPIDFRGRLDLPEVAPEREALKATAVIADTLPEDFAREGATLILTDERLLGGKADREWAERLGRVDAAIRGAPVRTESHQMKVVDRRILVGILSLLALAIGATMSRHVVKRSVVVALCWTVGLAVVLAVLIHFAQIGPMPLVWLSMPIGAVVASVWLAARERVEVVDSSQQASMATKVAKPDESKRPKKRRKKRR
ncbi:hypothetical protein [Haloferula rosea]|uniref:CHASE2 domain-containing protein n=1 Tax=Haloferula rosea TaxID=490093 RepID=A0A934RBR6_9BACT|nr:hypothetical protein [Haloferula rosea]MBK1826843.1 hypothetical protein [Haloferula rosea]